MPIDLKASSRISCFDFNWRGRISCLSSQWQRHIILPYILLHRRRFHYCTPSLTATLTTSSSSELLAAATKAILKLGGQSRIRGTMTGRGGGEATRPPEVHRIRPRRGHGVHEGGRGRAAGRRRAAEPTRVDPSRPEPIRQHDAAGHDAATRRDAAAARSGATSQARLDEGSAVRLAGGM